MDHSQTVAGGNPKAPSNHRLLAEMGEMMSRAVFARAVILMLFDDLMRRVPSSAAYVAATQASGSQVIFDHRAMADDAHVIGHG